MADPLTDRALTDIRAIRAVNRAQVLAGGIKYPRLVTELSAADRAELIANMIEASRICEAIKHEKRGQMPDGWEEDFWSRRIDMCRNWQGGRR